MLIPPKLQSGDRVAILSPAFAAPAVAPELHEQATQRLTDADDVFFIDDRQMSIDGAAAVGIRGIVHRDNIATIAAIEGFLAG